MNAKNTKPIISRIQLEKLSSEMRMQAKVVAIADNSRILWRREGHSRCLANLPLLLCEVGFAPFQVEFADR